MLGTVNNKVPYTNSHISKAEDGKNQPINANGKAGDVSKAEQSKSLGAERDEYIHSDGASEKSHGIYQLEKDENGNQKIRFDRPDPAGKDKSAEFAPETKQADKSPESASNPERDGMLPENPGKENEPKKPEKGNGPEKPGDKKGGQWGTANTDNVDREIKRIRDKKQQLTQQMNAVRGDEEKRKDLEQQLSQVEAELLQKDTDTYRRANTTFTSSDE